MAKSTKPKRTWKYTDDFKLEAVKLSHKKGIQVQQAAKQLDIHPFMLSRWRKEYREGTLQGKKPEKTTVNKKKKTVNAKEIKETERLKKRIAFLEKENDTLKKWQRYLAEVHQNDLDASKNLDKN